MNLQTSVFLGMLHFIFKIFFEKKKITHRLRRYTDKSSIYFEMVMFITKNPNKKCKPFDIWAYLSGMNYEEYHVALRAYTRRISCCFACIYKEYHVVLRAYIKNIMLFCVHI